MPQIVIGRYERDVLRLRMEAIVRAAGHGNIALTRKIRIGGIAQHLFIDGANDVGSIQQFIRIQARHRAGHDVANRIHAGL